MRALSRIALASALTIGLGGAAMANTATINMDNGNGHVAKGTTHTSMQTRTTHRRIVTLRRMHRGHRWTMHRGWRRYGYPMYGYGYGSSWAPARSGISSSYSGNVTETMGTSGSAGVNN